MPGIFGAIASRPDRNPQPVAAAMLEILLHHPWYRTLLIQDGTRCIGATSTNPCFDRERFFAEDPEALLLVEGTAFVVDGKIMSAYSEHLARRMLDLYLIHGDEFIERIGGHFNMVVIDRTSCRVQLLNDKLGFASLYWYADDQVFLFGPELKTFLAWRGLDRRIDIAAAATFLANQCPLGSATFLQDVTLLDPASRVVWNGQGVSTARRWQADPRPEVDRPREDILDEAEALLKRSVEKRLPRGQDERTVVALSGGLDSRLLLHLVRDQRDDLDIFTHGHLENSDWKIAQQTARAMGLEARHRRIEINPEWAGQYARQAVWLNDGQLNMRNATTLGVSTVLGPGPIPYINGIIGSFMSIGGPRCSEADLQPAHHDFLTQQNILKMSGIAEGVAGFSKFLAPEAADMMRYRAQEQALEAFNEWSFAPLLGDQKLMFFNFNFGRRMQGTNDILKFQFHDLLPFIDEELFEFSLRIPLELKCGMALYHHFYRTRLEALARLPWQHTGHDLFTSSNRIRKTARRRRQAEEFNRMLRKMSCGRINIRSRHAYHDRPAWLRNQKVFRDEIYGVLSNVGSTGCDWFDQAKVNSIRARFDRGEDKLFHILAQIYTMVVWHEQFLRDTTQGAELSHLVP